MSTLRSRSDRGGGSRVIAGRRGGGKDGGSLTGLERSRKGRVVLQDSCGVIDLASFGSMLHAF
jgi:hypothetical protein